MRRLVLSILLTTLSLALPRFQASGAAVDSLIEIQEDTPQQRRSTPADESADSGSLAADVADEPANPLPGALACFAVAIVAAVGLVALWLRRRKVVEPIGPMVLPGTQVNHRRVTRTIQRRSPAPLRRHKKAKQNVGMHWAAGMHCAEVECDGFAMCPNGAKQDRGTHSAYVEGPMSRTTVLSRTPKIVPRQKRSGALPLQSVLHDLPAPVRSQRSDLAEIYFLPSCQAMPSLAFWTLASGC